LIFNVNAKNRRVAPLSRSRAREPPENHGERARCDSKVIDVCTNSVKHFGTDDGALVAQEARYIATKQAEMQLDCLSRNVRSEIEE
jgi:hypothetical protein